MRYAFPAADLNAEATELLHGSGGIPAAFGPALSARVAEGDASGLIRISR